MKPAFPFFAAIVSLLLAPGLLARAQEAQRVIEGATPVNTVDPMDAAKYLGTTYKKESDGFRITPPAGSRLISRQGVDLVSFIVDNKSWGGSLQRISLQKPMTLDDFIATTKADITRNAGVVTPENQQVNVFKGVQILQDKRLKKGEYDAALFTFSAQVDLGPMVSEGVAQKMGLQLPNKPAGQANAVQTVSLLRQELIVRIKDGLFVVLMLYTPLNDRAAATRTWELMLPEFEIFDSATIVRRRTEAAKAGREWLVQRSAEELRTKLINQAQYFRMTIGSKDVGYFRFDELTQESGPGGTLADVVRDGHKGIIVAVNFRSFDDDGTINYGQNEAFWSFAKDARGEPIPAYSCWQNTSKTKTKVITSTPGRPGVPSVQQILPWRQENGILTQTGLPGPTVPFQISVSLAGDPGQRLANGVNALIPLEGAPPLPKALEYTWTRLVDLNKPLEMTFSTFDSKTSKMTTRNLIVTGTRENVAIDGRAESCYKCVDEIDPNSTTLWVDASGKIRMMKTSDQSVMIPTTEAAMTTRWAKRLAEQ